MNSLQNSVPKLRFKEFKKDWETHLFNDIATFSKGKSISKSDIVENGETECIRYGELYTEYNEVISGIVSKTNLPKKGLVLSDANDIIIPSSGETQLDIATASCVLKGGVALGGDLNIIKTKNNGVFISYYLNSTKKNKIASLAQGVSVVHLYTKQLKGLYLNLPNNEEQQKVATFLTAVDKKLTQLQEKKSLLEEYKKGVMQQIFSQELRFKPVLSEVEGDENGNAFPDWEEKKLGEIFDFLRGSAFSKSDIVKNGSKKCIHYGELFTKYNEVINKIYSRTERLGTMSVVGDILMPSSDVTPSGLATASTINEEDVLLGGDINILRPRIKCNSNFISYLLNFSTKKIIQVVSGTTVKHIYNKDLKILSFLIPNSIKEQTQIANFLRAIDKKIELVNTQIENTQQFKRGLLQQMFV